MIGISRCNLSDWTLDTRVEPTIRVGIILPEDEMTRVRLIIPSDGHRAVGNGASTEPVEPGKAEVFVGDQQVILQTAGGRTGPCPAIVLQSADPSPRPDSGVQVKSVVAGRGFHWQKRIHPTFSGALEFRAVDGHLLVVNELPLEAYLPGVIASEMSGGCPIEFLKSQCLVARSWVLARTERKHEDLPIDRCSDDCCQRYQGTYHLTASAVEAVHATAGQVLVDRQDRIIDANYSKSCGGIIEAPEHVWSMTKPGQRAAPDASPGSEVFRFMPVTEDNLDEYLEGDWLARTDVFCSPNVVAPAELPKYLGSVDERGSYFRWRLEYRRRDLEDLLREKLLSKPQWSQAAPIQTLTDMRVLTRGLSGRASSLAVDYLDPMGRQHTVTLSNEYTIREVLHRNFLYSSAFKIRVEREGEGAPSWFRLTGAGWGHGAGLCQIGALGMALKGYDAEAIVKHYFADVSIKTCYQRADGHA